MAIWWFLAPAVFALLIWALLRNARGPSTSSESPEEVLKRRYAEGEIDREMYLRMLSDIQGR
jgi:putative membrane protein